MYEQEGKFAQALAKDICVYIDQLKKEQHLLITIHQLDAKVSPCWYLFLPYNMHESIYCLTVKESSEAWEHCILCQKRVLQKAQNEGMYIGDCWAGCREMIFPICDAQNVCVAFLSVGGYQTEKRKAQERILSASKNYCLGYQKLSVSYALLKKEMPDIEEIKKRIRPLQHMFTLLIDQYTKYTISPLKEGANNMYECLLVYINRNFAQPLTLKHLAEHFNSSYSYVSHIFSKFGKESFTEYLLHIRMEAAKKFLLYSDLSITEIASFVGYDDSNYFSNVFKKKENVSPTIWRKNNKQKGEENEQRI